MEQNRENGNYTFTPVVSIIVLTYRHFDSLKENIDSILIQDYTNYEVIISDDGSPNFDQSYIESLFKDSEKKKQFHIIKHEKNGGTVKNYNSAVMRASGEIIVPLSQDDKFITTDALSTIVGAFSGKNVKICYALRQRGDRIMPTRKSLDILLEGDKRKTWCRMACNSFIYGASLYFRKDYLVDIGLFDERYTLLEDYPIVMKIIDSGTEIVLLNKPLLDYGEGGVSGSTSVKFVEDEVLLHNEMISQADRYMHSALFKEYIVYKRNRWKKYLDKHDHSAYGNILIDLFIIVTLGIAKSRHIDLTDLRFDLLWYLDRIASHGHKKDIEACK